MSVGSPTAGITQYAALTLIPLMIKSSRQEGDQWECCLATRKDGMIFAELASAPMVWGSSEAVSPCKSACMSPSYVQERQSPFSSYYTLFLFSLLSKLESGFFSLDSICISLSDFVKNDHPDKTALET